ncbi:prohead protease inhibitor [Vibrio phage D479]
MSLSSLTKRKLIEYIEENFPDVEFDKNLPKVSILELIKDRDLVIEPEVVVDEEEVKEESELVEQEVPALEKFRPRWAPTFRRGNEYYISMSPEMIHSWNSGRRDSADLQTIEYWIKKRGKLLVRNNARDNFVYLR